MILGWIAAALGTTLGGLLLFEARQVRTLRRRVAESRPTETRRIQAERLAAMGRLAAQVAHEIRTPLSSISLNLEMIQDEIQNPQGDGCELVSTALGEVDRLNGLVDEYLLFSRLPKPNPRKTRIDEVIQHMTQQMIMPRGIRFVTRFAVPAPEIRFDPDLIRRALDHLVKNAVEAMAKGGEIQIETEFIDGYVAIRVGDDGRGMAPQIRDRLFDPFFTTKANGTGLGLATAQHIVFEHNGHIQVESRPGEGSVFTIYLPL